MGPEGNIPGGAARLIIIIQIENSRLINHIDYIARIIDDCALRNILTIPMTTTIKDIAYA
jgi:hypothetical protein